MKKKILVVTGTRAEYGLLRSSMDAIRAHQSLELRLLVTGMHTLSAYGSTKNEIVRDGYMIDHLVTIPENLDMLQNLTTETDGIRAYCIDHRPDCILILGDRDEPLAAALVALHLGIPLAHIHGGDITGPGVDEGIRHAITKLAHLHFPATKESAARIAGMGEEPWRICVAGTPGLDALSPGKIFARETVAKELSIDSARPWLCVIQHPVALDDTPLVTQISTTLAALEKFNTHERIVIYPNSDSGSELFIQAIETADGLHRFASLPRQTFVGLLAASEAIVGNSSAGIIEAGFLGTPTVDIGNRQEGRERGESVLHTQYDAEEIAHSISKAITLKRECTGASFATPYGGGNAGSRIAARLAETLDDPRLLRKRISTGEFSGV